MTTMIYPYGGAPASEVWDVNRGSSRTGERAVVRTLAPANRTAERTAAPAGGRALPQHDGFEPGRERRDNLALGGLMAAALIAGSLFGGAFGAGDAPVQPSSVLEAAR
ncbi:hypothetical protein V6D40_01225 [Corynebacterium sp. Q4381]|uniref:hypothetical protein n=1 Tax=Corynebacterium sp. Marseille-Q4381 TaxID=3121597 RepID=UPI002FE5406A